MTEKDFIERGSYYHIYNHGNGSDMIFKSGENYSFFLRQCGKYMNDVWELIGWCQMPNHYHLLVKIREDITGVATEDDVNKKVYMQFSHFTNSYAKAINKAYNRRGSLFVKTFKRKKITSDIYLKRVIRYIHLNPVHHGFTSCPEKWMYSSFNLSIQDFRSGNHNELNSIFADEEEFLNFHAK